jgi:DivIVA domain-containing protein
MARLVTSKEVNDKVFRSKNHDKWYDADEVDAFLDDIADTLDFLEQENIKPILLSMSVRKRNNPFQPDETRP